MARTKATAISGAVEGLVDEAVLRRLIGEAGGILGAIHGKKGKQFLRQRLPGYNLAAHHFPWVVLVDLDQDADCAPPFRAQWLSQPAPRMCFRIAVREVEAWLLADRERMAQFLSVPVSRIPADMEALADAKKVVVDLAVRSRRREIREDIIPGPGSGRKVGRAYVSRMIEFTHRDWRPGIAAEHSESLRRCRARIEQLVKSASGRG